MKCVLVTIVLVTIRLHRGQTKITPEGTVWAQNYRKEMVDQWKLYSEDKTEMG